MAMTIEYIENWKLKTLVNTVVKTVFCPSFTTLYSLRELLKNHDSYLGAQNIYFENNGAYTGEISGDMLNEAGCEYVIIGHSERRHVMGETDYKITLKFRQSIAVNLVPILCVGETFDQRKNNSTEAVLKKQLAAAFSDCDPENTRSYIIAYEPVWAIGSGLAATNEIIAESHLLIRNILNEIGFNGNSTSILYGGSVSEKNAPGIAAIIDVDGFLIGGASLDVEKFYNIYQSL